MPPVDIQTSAPFRRLLKRLARKHRSLLNDLETLYEELRQQPRLGTALGNNCYKIRLAVQSKGQGKRGGMRVITEIEITFEAAEKGEITVVHLAAIYDKAEQGDLTEPELRAIITEIRAGRPTR